MEGRRRISSEKKILPVKEESRQKKKNTYTRTSRTEEQCGLLEKDEGIIGAGGCGRASKKHSSYFVIREEEYFQFQNFV